MTQNIWPPGPKFRRKVRLALCLGSFVIIASGPAGAGALLDYVRDYDLNDYSLGLSVSTSQNPFLGATNSTIAYPYLTSFTHSTLNDDWFLVRGENIGFRYAAKSDWEFGVMGRVQTLGLGTSGGDALDGLEERRWTIEAGPLIGWRRWPVQVQFRSYWDMANRHDSTTNELEFSLPGKFERGFFVPSVMLTYLSAGYSSYYYGVSDPEMTPSRPVYEPGAVINTQVGFTLGYELTPRWLLSTTVGIEFLASAVTASPIVERDRLWSASVGLAYNANLFQPREYHGDPPKLPIEIRLAAFNSTIDTSVIRDASDGQPGGEVDLEDFLGIADRQTIFQLDALLRIGYYHRLELGYFELQRRSMTTLERDINFGDQTFVAGTEVETSTRSQVVRLAYSYSLMRDQQKELGVSLGVGFLQFEAGLRAESTAQFERLTVNAPLPTIGVFGSVALGSKWRLSADINVFSLDFDRYEGFMSYLNLGLDRKFGDVLGAGIGYNFYGTRLKSKNDTLRGTLRTRYYGPKLYFSLNF